MPPSQKETPLKRNDMTTISDPDISDNDLSTRSKTPKPRDGNCSIASELPLKEAKGRSKATFMTLPVEIRLQIYHILLVKYSYLDGPPMLKYGVTKMNLGMLRTCRQIYQEAKSIFYTQHEFDFSNLRNLLKFVNDIGPANLKLVKAVHFRDDTNQFNSLWQIFDMLVDDTNVSAGGVDSILVKERARSTTIEYYGEARGTTTEQHYARALKYVRGIEGKLNPKHIPFLGMISFSGRRFGLVFLH